ncbi:acyl carrier protein [Pararhodobacter sp. CCB-MM2]|uniref:acyl carrier protein n=1 Tax=Pararhodobacter sp. CCB-MM2 TaxID=1786003 RepID=UPI000831F5C6|nr:acyl carrier protein [Pararhodobacter sp. CCB-MM2]
MPGPALDPLARIRPAIAESFPLFAATMASGTRSAGHDIDSLDLISLVIDVEDTFDVEFPSEAFDAIATPGDLAEALDRQLSVAGGAA